MFLPPRAALRRPAPPSVAFLPPFAALRRPAPPSVAFLPPLAALRRPSPPITVSMDSKPRGLDGVVAAQTRLSHVDGQAGELIIGGYQLRELAGRVSFEEAAHLLWRGALPSRDELAGLRREIAALRPLPEQAMHVLRAPAKSPP